MSQPKQGNYFMLPNEIFNMDLTAEEIALYAFLMRMEDRKTFTCYPALKTIGKALKMGSKNTVMKYVKPHTARLMLFCRFRQSQTFRP